METIKFWKCMSILINNYHAVYKKVFACKMVAVRKVKKGLAGVDFDYHVGCKRKMFDIIAITNGMDTLDSTKNELMDTLLSVSSDNSWEGFIISFKFLMKGDELSIDALGIIDFVNTQYTCLFRSEILDDFQISFSAGKMDVLALSNKKSVDGDQWVEFVLKPKLKKWYISKREKDTVLSSLHIIDIEMYNELYKKLKAKHAAEIFSIWQECTDPLKFVYEDIAIAAYLICVWEKYDCRPKYFADLGCGNGLLVYILNQEGYPGCGYDVRSRKIWSLYPKTVILFEETIMPSEFQLPSEVDWIIGNHSDELSPWIPVIAALSTYKTKYFVLPCCPFEFSGAKFQRRNSKLSSYNDFIDYVEKVSQVCGFRTLKDRLKIPSTKRLAFIGIGRQYVQLRHQEICLSIREFLTDQIKENSIKLREKHEVVRNCTQINSDVLDSLVKKIFIFLLEPEKANQNQITWNNGSKRTLKEIAQYLLPEDLKIIKSECGGIKTLMKNRHEIFELTPGDNVQIRKPKPRDPTETRPLTIKKRNCFFALNHPNGCPLSGTDCTFIHS